MEKDQPFRYRILEVGECLLISSLSFDNQVCLLISSLPGKGPRTFVESQGLPSDSTCVLEADPGKLDIKRRKPGILFISLQADSLFKLAIMT